jgi:phenylpyruvate tautomerase PptA (4-oxalocrotonate tautomerase family)
MPVLEIEIVLRRDEILRPGLAAELAEGAGQVFQAPPGTTWVRLRSLEQGNYAESGGGPPDGVSPVFVAVLKRTLPGMEQRRVEAARLAAAVAQACARPVENVHVLYLPEGDGRMAFGGEL